MSFLKTALRLCPHVRAAPRIFTRFNSTSSISLTAKLYPLEKNTVTEQDVDEWLKAIETLKAGNKAPETAAEVYLSQLLQPEDYLRQKYEPTAEQKEEVERYKNKPVPILQDPVVQNLTHLIMRDGKKTRAQTQVSKALYMVYLKLRQDPVQVLYETLDKLGPLFHTKVKLTGTAKSKTVPLPLNRRQRNRYAILWILEGAKKKKSSDFSVRLAEEIISAYEGKSSGYDKKLQLHKQAIAHRAYIEL